MLKAVIRFSLNYASLVVIAAVLLVAYAGYRLPRMSVDVFPELNAPTVTIMAESGGLAADEVEQYVTFPIESAVNGMTGVRRVRSASAIGLSIVWVDLDWGADLYDARQLVAERMATARGSLPEGVEPFITPITSIAGEVMLVSVSSPNGSVSPMELRSFAEFELRNSILAVPGVAQVVAIGGELPEYQVNVDQDRLRLYGLTISDVVEAAGQAHSTASAGYLVNVDNFEIPIRQQSRVTRPRDIEDTVIKYHEGVPVTIGQVADVRLGPALKRGTASEGGQPAVILSVQKSPGANTLALTDALDEVFDQIEPTLPEGVELNRDVMRQSHFIDRAVHNVTKVLGEAVLIVLVVLILFLMNVRTTIITLTAIPISLAVGLLMMDAMDLGLNVMTLGGLTVAIGVLVDDAIIDVENVFRRLQQNRARPEAERRPFAEVIFEASNEIRPAMVFATVIIVMVFVPLLFLQGLEGRFFQPLALTYMVAIVASLVVALTVVPALCRFLLKGRLGGGGEARDGFLVRWLKRAYEPTLRLALRARLWVLGGAGAATIAALWLASTFGTSFLPSFNEGTFTVFLLAPPGTSIVESDRLATQVERQLVEIEGVRSVSRRTGRAERDEHAEPVSNSEIEVTVEAGHDRHEVRAEIDRVLDSVPGITTMVGQPIEHRLSHVLSGTPAAIAINVYGEDLNGLRQVAKDIAAELEGLPGARDVNANREVMITSLPIRYRHAELAAAGLSPASAAEQVREAIYGEVVDTVNHGIRRYDLVVRLAPENRESIQQVRDLLLTGRGGATVRLSDVADIGPQRSSNLITRENAQRKAVVSLNVAEGSNLGDLVEQVRERVDPIVQRAGFTVSYGGQFEAQQSASRTILVAGVAVAVVMLMLLQISTGSLRAAVLVMLNMPLALIGGILAIYLTEGGGAVANTLALLGVGGAYTPPVISIASMVGFITLFGIAVRNGILLINHYHHLVREEHATLGEAIVRGSMERLSPILMTAISAALGLMPLALAAGEPGSELLAPLAIVTLGGLLTSTFLNLIVVPAGYSLAFGHKPEPRASGAKGRRARLRRKGHRSKKASKPSLLNKED
jgi:HME family heavy-metal exporter